MATLGTHHSSYEGFAGAASRRRAMAFGLAGFTALAATGLLLAGCAAPPKPVVTPVSITLVALKSPGPFVGADFFSLFEKDQATLGAELVQREEVLLRPGESKKLDLVLPADAKAIGVMAAFRDLDHAHWREVRAVEPGKGQILTVGFGARLIKIDAKPGPTPP
jgi:type VI secretion system protein VasD